MKRDLTPPNLRTYRLVGGPFDGQEAEISDGVDEFWWDIPSDDLEELLAASVKIKQGALALMPTRRACYRKVRLEEGNLVGIRHVFQFEGWM